MIDHTSLSSVLLSLRPYAGPIALMIVFVTALTFGFALDATSNIPEPYGRISSIVGWAYFTAWGLSFWPQILTNYVRRSVVGISFDYQLYSLVGFVCYMIFNCAFFYSDAVQAEYMPFHSGHHNAVQVNDVFFSIYAVLASLVVVFQCLVYPRGGQTLSPVAQAIAGVAAAGCALFYAAAVVYPSTFFTTLNFLYLLSYVKLAATVVKWIPQVYLNYTRKSTVGFSVWGVLLDLLGSILSIGQLVMDGAVTDDWSAVTGDPVKFGLGAVCIFFDGLVLFQHYVLYADAHDDSHHHEGNPLLKKKVVSTKKATVVLCRP
ncbi:Aste57867_16932 [Aphanomyces stellatus]|uniref:Aste57867_16932 protein n=1 Tax=Aphanomyces stellatus TaxID=120398 RepID=A0A485L6Q3_9STRA|nr:hypothetical protein As57867_016874 [Aphanomyces stellatus]VFT93694.1 Aste57867_16932 [Aphanomyces stellatus]